MVIDRVQRMCLPIEDFVGRLSVSPVANQCEGNDWSYGQDQAYKRLTAPAPFQSKIFWGRSSLLSILLTGISQMGCQEFKEMDICKESDKGLSPEILENPEEVSEEAKERFFRLLPIFLPNRFLKTIQAIRIVDSVAIPAGLQGYEENRLDAPARALEGTMEVRKDYFEVTEVSEEEQRLASKSYYDDLEGSKIRQLFETLIHEVGHLLQFQLSPSQRHQWEQIHNAYPNAESCLSNYCGANANEDFAEMFVTIVMKPALVYRAAILDPGIKAKFDFFKENIYCGEEPIPFGTEFFDIFYNRSSPIYFEPVNNEVVLEMQPGWEHIQALLDNPEASHLHSDIAYEVARKWSQFPMVPPLGYLYWMARATNTHSAFQQLPYEDYSYKTDHTDAKGRANPLYSHSFTPMRDFLESFGSYLEYESLIASFGLFLENISRRALLEDPDLPFSGLPSYLRAAMIYLIDCFKLAPLERNNRELNGVSDLQSFADHFKMAWSLFPPQVKTLLFEDPKGLAKTLENLVATDKLSVAETLFSTVQVDWSKYIQSKIEANPGDSRFDSHRVYSSFLNAHAHVAQGHIDRLWNGDGSLERALELIEIILVTYNVFETIPQRYSENIDLFKKLFISLGDFVVSEQPEFSEGMKEKMANTLRLFSQKFSLESGEAERQLNDRLRLAASFLFAMAEGPQSETAQEFFKVFAEDWSRLESLVNFSEEGEKGREIALAYCDRLLDETISPADPSLFYAFLNIKGDIYMRASNEYDDIDDRGSSLKVQALLYYLDSEISFLDIYPRSEWVGDVNIELSIIGFDIQFLLETLIEPGYVFVYLSPDEKRAIRDKLEEIIRHPEAGIIMKSYYLYMSGLVSESLNEGERACEAWREALEILPESPFDLKIRAKIEGEWACREE